MPTTTAPSSSRDRRSSHRVPLSAEVHLASRDNLYAGRARDISTSGLFIHTAAALDVGTAVGVRFTIADKTFACLSEVVWVLRDRLGRPAGLGVRFLHVSPPLQKAIASFMTRRPPIGFDFEPSSTTPPSSPPRRAGRPIVSAH